MGKDWLKSLPEPGPAFYIGAEDDKDELHIRLAGIASHYQGIAFKNLRNLHILSLPGAGRYPLRARHAAARLNPTFLSANLYEAAGGYQAEKYDSIDTLSRAFGGNEIDRVQVYAPLPNHMQALAMVWGSAAPSTVLSHPSVAGISSGSGISGSTAWHGAFRFRQYLKGAKAEPGEQPDSDLRELQFKKNQYGPMGDPIVLRYQRGLFLPEGGLSIIEKAARESEVEAVLIGIGRKLEADGNELSPAQQSHSYAPTVISRDPQAKGIKKAEFVAAFERLRSSSRLSVETLRQGTTREKKVIKFESAKG